MGCPLLSGRPEQPLALRLSLPYKTISVNSALESYQLFVHYMNYLSEGGHSSLPLFAA
jgi:hypothetical protein